MEWGGGAVCNFAISHYVDGFKDRPVRKINNLIFKMLSKNLLTIKQEHKAKYMLNAPLDEFTEEGREEGWIGEEREKKDNEKRSDD